MLVRSTFCSGYACVRQHPWFCCACGTSERLFFFAGQGEHGILHGWFARSARTAHGSGAVCDLWRIIGTGKGCNRFQVPLGDMDVGLLYRVSCITCTSLCLPVGSGTLFSSDQQYVTRISKAWVFEQEARSWLQVFSQMQPKLHRWSSLHISVQRRV